MCFWRAHGKTINVENVRLILNYPSSAIEARDSNKFLSHTETCDLLGVSYPTFLGNSNYLIPFDISSVDHF